MSVWRGAGSPDIIKPLASTVFRKTGQLGYVVTAYERYSEKAPILKRLVSGRRLVSSASKKVYIRPVLPTTRAVIRSGAVGPCRAAPPDRRRAAPPERGAAAPPEREGAAAPRTHVQGRD
ncbi:hypothetical protein L596_012362 [Steinernema carpocapsae]|uniref:Uncharacterized protein n=1 Tax=Steinernema carpocapsae TaxID=34508 RepID=A0A4V6XWF1_STECR|nr:hypothetical protein L596_012362 [Steinernema carpocapsae]